MESTEVCSFPECGRPVRVKIHGLCQTHYKMHRKGIPLRPIRPKEASGRFELDAIRGEGCWGWRGHKDDLGYSRICTNGSSIPAHRFSWELVNGPMPVGKVLDHTCRNRWCVNPEHVQPVTQKQNMENRGLEGNGPLGVRGVFWEKAAGKYRVQVGHNGAKHHGGLFTDLAEAEAAAIALRNKLHTNNLLDRSS